MYSYSYSNLCSYVCSYSYTFRHTPAWARPGGLFSWIWGPWPRTCARLAQIVDFGHIPGWAAPGAYFPGFGPLARDMRQTRSDRPFWTYSCLGGPGGLFSWIWAPGPGHAPDSLRSSISDIFLRGRPYPDFSKMYNDLAYKPYVDHFFQTLCKSFLQTLCKFVLQTLCKAFLYLVLDTWS